jgi:hypothetical protein
MEESRFVFPLKSRRPAYAWQKLFEATHALCIGAPIENRLRIAGFHLFQLGRGNDLPHDLRTNYATIMKGLKSVGDYPDVEECEYLANAVVDLFDEVCRRMSS